MAWKDQLNTASNTGGGCLELAQTALEQRQQQEQEQEQPEPSASGSVPRRGLIQLATAGLASAFGIGTVSATTPEANGEYECTGRMKPDCIRRAAMAAGAACYPCRVAPSKPTCAGCAITLLLQGELTATECCSGTWRQTEP